MKKLNLDESGRKDLLKTVERNREVFVESEKDARFFYKAKMPAEMKERIKYVHEEFTKLEKRVPEAKTESDAKSIRDRGVELEDQFVHILPPQDLPIEAHLLLEELVSWRVPEETLKHVRADVKIVDAGDAKEEVKRSYLLKIVEEYEYWDGYMDWAEKRIFVMSAVSFGVSLAGLIFALLFFFSSKALIPGILAAGICGASLSVLLKLPFLKEYGVFREAMFKVLARIATGIAAAAVGFGLLASGIINLVLEVDGTKTSVSAIINKFDAAPTVVWGLIFLAFGILFGFAERALGLFQETFFGKLGGAKKEEGEEEKEETPPAFTASLGSDKSQALGRKK